MASGNKLQLRMGTTAGIKTWSFNYAKSNASTANINALMDAMITNGSIYKYPPLTKESATIIQTSEINVPVS